MKDSLYFKQAQLMLRVMPHVSAEACFALKGGTALANIGEALQRIATAMRRTVPGVTVQEIRARGAEHVSKSSISTAEATIKIEPNLVLRGTVFSQAERELSEQAEELIEASATAITLAVADLYGGKLCAALDRQHPRDIFDIKILMDSEGITDEIRTVFVLLIKQGQSDWDLMPLSGIDQLPAIQWKLINIRK